MTALPTVQQAVHAGDCMCPRCVPYVRHGEPKLSLKSGGMVYPCGRVVGEPDAKAVHCQTWVNHRERITCRACMAVVPLSALVEVDRDPQTLMLEARGHYSPDADEVSVSDVIVRTTWRRTKIDEWPKAVQDELLEALTREVERRFAP